MGRACQELIRQGCAVSQSHTDFKVRSISTIELYWASTFPEWPVPEDKWIRGWLNATDCDVNVVMTAIDRIARKVKSGGVTDPQHASKLITLHLRYDVPLMKRKSFV